MGTNVARNERQQHVMRTREILAGRPFREYGRPDKGAEGERQMREGPREREREKIIDNQIDDRRSVREHQMRVCWVFIVKDPEPSPLQDSFGVRQKGGLPGPPPRSASSRIHCCPGGLNRGSIAQVGSGPNCFQALGSSPGLLQSPML